MACKRIHQLFCFVDGFLMLICRVKYLFVPLSPFCHSVYPVLVTHFIYLCAWLHSCAHVFFIMLFHCHPVSTHSIQCGLLEGLAGTKRVHIAALFTPASWIAWKKRGEEKKNLVKRNPQQWTQKKCTMLTVFQIPLIALSTMRESRRFLLSSTSTNNRLTKASQLRFCSQTKPPRLSKCSYWRETKFFQLVPSFFLRVKRREKREQREGKKRENGHWAGNVRSFEELATFSGVSQAFII